MTRGVLIFAINNSVVNYIKLALANAQLIRHYLGVPVSLVTNAETLAKEAHFKDNEDQYRKVFDQIIMHDEEFSGNFRYYHDTHFYKIQGAFLNQSRVTAYELTPYDETLLIDADYLIFDDKLNGVWGSPENALMNRDAIRVGGTQITGNERHLCPTGPRMFWATVIYFNKSELSHLLFQMADHVRNNWEYYSLLYQLPEQKKQGAKQLFRNDYAFTIAAHSLSGFQEPNVIKPLPVPYILTMLDRDQVFKVIDDGLWVFVNHMVEDWKFYALKVEGMSVHCMNKLSLNNHTDELLRRYA